MASARTLKRRRQRQNPAWKRHREPLSPALQWVVREQVEFWKRSLDLSKQLQRGYEAASKVSGAAIGHTIQVRLPNRFTS